jgi:hypothetical protein
MLKAVNDSMGGAGVNIGYLEKPKLGIKIQIYPNRSLR